jgi:hypothetical protein
MAGQKARSAVVKTEVPSHPRLGIGRKKGVDVGIKPGQARA